MLRQQTNNNKRGQSKFGSPMNQFGAYEIVGQQNSDVESLFSGDYEIVGAAQKRQRMNPGVRQEPTPRREYHQILPFSSLAFAAGESRTLSITPQRTFRPEFLGVSSAHTGPNFTISTYTIGQDNMYVAQGDLIADLLSEVSVNMNRIVGYTANLGTIIVLVVKNISAGTANFYGAFTGTSLGN